MHGRNFKQSKGVKLNRMGELQSIQQRVTELMVREDP
jgi:hypothetical protein